MNKITDLPKNELIDFVHKHDFKDPLDHPLVNWVCFQELIQDYFELKLLQNKGNDQNLIDFAINFIAKHKDNLLARNLLSLAKILSIPPVLILDKETKTAVITQYDLEMLALYAYKQDFISASKAAELLGKTVYDIRASLDKHHE